MKRKRRKQVVPPSLPRGPLETFLEKVEGGVETALQCLRYSPLRDERADRILEGCGNGKTLDQVAEGVITASELVGMIVAGMHKYSKDLREMLIAVSLPKLVKASLEHSENPILGEAERREWLKAQGYLPVQKGAQITVNPTIQIANVGQGRLPRFEDDVREIPAQVEEWDSDEPQE